MSTPFKAAVAAMTLAASMTLTLPAQASGSSDYYVTITNLTNAVIFTPILVTSHRRSIDFFEPGAPASDDLSTIAESGDVGPMTTTLNADRDVVDVQNSGGLLPPGQSVTVIIDGKRGARYASVASMMLPTNDGFIGLSNAELPKRGSVTYYSPGYDAGSEANDELCINIPGGADCAGVGGSPGENEGDEGYVHIHRGIHGIGDLTAAVYDWRNPTARITISRVRGKKGR